MPEPTEQGVLDPIPSSFSYAYVAECNQAKIAFLQIAGGKGVETTMALPHLLNPGCQEETYAVTEQANVLAEQAFQCPMPK